MRRRLAGILRRLGWDRNPVRRRVDRLQTILTSAFLILVLAGTPLTAWLVADRVYLSGERAANRQRMTDEQVPAIVLRTGDVAANGAGHFIDETAHLRWRDQKGGVRSGAATVDFPARIGAVLPVWIDASGGLTSPSRTHEQTVSDGVRAGAAVAMGMATVSIVGYLLARRRLDRHRYRQWENDWAAMAPL